MCILYFLSLHLGLLLVEFSDQKMGTVEYLVPYLLLYGMSRGLWEDMNKTVLSVHLESNIDPANASGGFAVITFIAGLSAAAGYFSFLFIPPHEVEKCIFWSALGSVCVFIGYRVMGGYCNDVGLCKKKKKHPAKKKSKTTSGTSNSKNQNSLGVSVNDYENEHAIP